MLVTGVMRAVVAAGYGPLEGVIGALVIANSLLVLPLMV